MATKPQPAAKAPPASPTREGRTPTDPFEVMKPTDAWDRKCPHCGGRMLFETPQVYNETVFECQNQRCRAQVKVTDHYDAKNRFLHEEVNLHHMLPIGEEGRRYV